LVAGRMFRGRAVGLREEEVDGVVDEAVRAEEREERGAAWAA